jgi:predicted HAD superfamily phosphohydrolase YqeG
MAEVPVSNKDLDDVIYQVTRDFIEEKSMNGVVEEVDEKLVQETTQDVIFIVERYMSYINELMSKASLNQASKLTLDK